MNVLEVTFDEFGRISDCPIDFKILRGGYKDILINVRVPKSLLVLPVVDIETGENVVGNNIRVGAIIRTSTGQNLQTQRYEFQRVKDFLIDNVEYRLYQRRMPREFTMWETINRMESITLGKLELIFNIINWTKDENGENVEEIVTSKIIELAVYPSDYLENEQEIDDPTDFSLLQSQVNEIQLLYNESTHKQLREDIDNHKSNKDNPHFVTKTQVGLANVDNTADIDKPVSTAQQEEFNKKVDRVDGKELSANDFTDEYKLSVELNENARHTHSNKVLLDTYTQTEESLATAVEQKHIHDNKSVLDQTTESFTTDLKQALETLISLMNDNDADTTVNTIREVLNVFALYPEGVTVFNALATKVDKETGKGLSTNDLTNELLNTINQNTSARHSHSNKTILDETNASFTTEQKEKLQNLENYNDAELRQLISGEESARNSAVENMQADLNSHKQDKANPHSVTKSQVGLGNVDNTSDINKPVSNAQQTELNKKVDKVEGKDLSSNDYTAEDKNKLSGIENGAQKNVQPNWNETDPNSDAFVQNKPVIPEGVAVVDNLTTESTTSSLSAKQGKVLDEKISGNSSRIGALESDNTINKSNISNLQSADVQNVKITGDQSIAGNKNFTGVFRINGGIVSYDPDSKTFSI